MEEEKKYFNEDGTLTDEGLMKYKCGVESGIVDSQTVDEDADNGVTVIKGGQNASDLQK